jgi:hypothetical protein
MNINFSFYVFIKKLLERTPPCRVLQSFEPAFAGGSSLENFALAQAYRVVSVKLRPVIKMLAQNRKRSITYTAGQLTYTIKDLSCVVSYKDHKIK